MMKGQKRIMSLTNDYNKAYFHQTEGNRLTENSDGTWQGNYHEGELKIHNRINNTAIIVIILGFVIIFCAFIYMIFTQNIDVGIVATGAGIITETISGVLFWYVSKASKDKWKYFNILNDNEEEERLLTEIRNMPNVKFKEKMLEKLVDAHCGSRNK